MSNQLDAVAPHELHQLAYPIAQLRHDPQNVRVHDDRNLAAVRKSLETFGWRNVVVVRRSDNVILAGNARITVARQMGLQMAPVLFVDADEKSSAKYALLDNRSAELATWDVETLMKELESMDEDMLSVAGFTPDEFKVFAEALEEAAEPEPAEAEEPAQPLKVTETHTQATAESEAIIQVRVEFTDELYERWKVALERAEAIEPGKSPSELALLAVLAR